MAEAEQCYSCKENNKVSTATVLCKICMELYCDDCAKCHRSFKITKDHKLFHLVPVQSTSKDKFEVASSSVLGSSDFVDFVYKDAQCTVPDRRGKYKAQAPKDPRVRARTNPGVLVSGSTPDNKSTDLSLRCDRLLVGKKKTTYDIQKKSGGYFGNKINFMICLNDGRLLLSDDATKRIVMFDKSFQVCAISSASNVVVWGMAVVDENEIAVTEGRKVCFYQITETAIEQLDKAFNVQFTSYDIKYNGKNYALSCSCRGSRFVIILDNNGNESYTIKPTEVFGQKCKLFNYLELDHRKDVIYVSDQETDRVLCFDFKSNPIWEAKLETSPSGLFLLQGSIFVVLPSLNEIIQLDINGKILGRVASDDHDVDPELICWQRSTNSFYVTSLSYPNILTAVEC